MEKKFEVVCKELNSLKSILTDVEDEKKRLVVEATRVSGILIYSVYLEILK